MHNLFGNLVFLENPLKAVCKLYTTKVGVVLNYKPTCWLKCFALQGAKVADEFCHLTPTKIQQISANSLAAASRCFLVWSCLCVCFSFRLPQYKQNMLIIWQWSGNRRANEAPRLEQKRSVLYLTLEIKKGWRNDDPTKIQSILILHGANRAIVCNTCDLDIHVAIWYRSGQTTSVVKYQWKQKRLQPVGVLHC